jgi:hypothetical protein
VSTRSSSASAFRQLRILDRLLTAEEVAERLG